MLESHFLPNETFVCTVCFKDEFSLTVLAATRFLTSSVKIIIFDVLGEMSGYGKSIITSFV